MKSVFEEYKQLWPSESHASLEPLLSRVPVLSYPKQAALLHRVLPSHVVIVVREAPFIEIVKLLDLGFQHVLQEGREDFPEELLAASLMVIRPEAFDRNPIPFFFAGFQPSAHIPAGERNFEMKFSKSEEKKVLMDWLSLFLDENPRMVSIKDICLQAADELITNAIFNAPVRSSGTRPYKDLPRESDITLPDSKRATLFASFSERRVIVGCYDVYGSLRRETLLEHLRLVFKEPTMQARAGSGGAGFGFKYMIENAANMYVMCSAGTSTLVACGFLLKGLRANLRAAKHFHVSFH